MGSKEVQVHGTLVITVPPGGLAQLEERLREATGHQAVLQVTGLELAFPGDPEAQRRWTGYVTEAGVRLELRFDPLLGELEVQDRLVIAEYTSTHSGDVYLDVKRPGALLQRVVRVVTSEHVQQTAVALRKITFIGGIYRDQLWHDEWGLNLTLLHELLTAPDNSGIVAQIYRISDMSATRVQYLRDFVVACKQRGVI